MLILNIVSLGCHDFLKYIQTVGHKFDIMDCENIDPNVTIRQLVIQKRKLLVAKVLLF